MAALLTMDEFRGMEMRVGEVLSVEPVIQVLYESTRLGGVLSEG